MKRVKMIVTSVVVLAIVGSAFAFNAKKIGKFCTTTSGGTGNCVALLSSKRTTDIAAQQFKYVVDWDGATCTTNSDCSTLARFTAD